MLHVSAPSGDERPEDDGPDRPLATAPGEVDLQGARHSLALRRLFMVALLVFLLLGLLNVFGVRTRETSGAGAGWELSVRYASVTRPGLATPWSVQVRRPGGFSGSVRVATTEEYLDLFDQNDLSPDPTSATSDGQRTIWEFEAPDGAEEMTISLDARVEPGVQLTGVEATTSVLDQDRPAVSVTYRTWVTP